MCRLFGSMGLSAPQLEAHLVSSPCSLFEQSRANPRRLQGDGWGIGYCVKGKAELVRSTAPIFEERDAFSKAVRSVKGRIVLAHIRRASNPRNLPKELLLRPENIQPFSWRNWLFVHNGTINLPDRAAAKLGSWRKRVQGTNDSEVYFWLLMKGIRSAGGARSGLRWAIKEIMEAWGEATEEERRAAKLPYVGLNCILSDGRRIYALCKYDSYKPKRDDNWLCGAEPPRPLYEMCYRLEDEGKRLVVASERTSPSEDWLPLKDGSLLTAEVKGGRVKAQVNSL